MPLLFTFCKTISTDRQGRDMDKLIECVVIAPKATVFDMNEVNDPKNEANRGRGAGRGYGQTVALTEKQVANLTKANVVVLKADYQPRSAADGAVQLAEAKAELDATKAKLAELDGDKPKNKGGRPRKADSE